MIRANETRTFWCMLEMHVCARRLVHHMHNALRSSLLISTSHVRTCQTSQSAHAEVGALEKQVEAAGKAAEAERKRHGDLVRERDILTKLKAQARPPLFLSSRSVLLCAGPWSMYLHVAGCHYEVRPVMCVDL